MFTGITNHTGSLVTGIVVLSGAATLHGGVAAADSNQDDQFLALLNQEGIPALSGVPSLITTAHKVCRTLDAGMSADAVVDAMVDYANSVTPADPGRLARTEARFITAAVEAYCPYDQGKIASITANFASGRNEPTHRGVAYTHNAVSSGSLIGAIPRGITPPNPPQIPAPPPTAQKLTPPLPVAAPPPPKQPPPPPKQAPPKQAPPPPQQVEPPAVGPQPGGAAGSGGGGSNGGDGGGGPTEASPTPPMRPGIVRLAP